MRQLTLTALCLVFALECFAQKNENYETKNEIGLHFLSYSADHFYDKYSQIRISTKKKKLFHILNGATYKRQLNDKNAIRTSIFYRELTGMAGSGQILTWGTKNLYEEHILKLGYERALNTRKLTPYFALDAGLYFVGFKGSRLLDHGTSLHEINGYGVGISPAFGINLKVSRHINLSVESCADFVPFTFKHRHSTKYYSNSRTETYSLKNFNARFNPLQKLSLNVKF